ncbi:MAG: radical SAM protein [Candidatus Aenigmarchaeota archaeon]|nr:radical SAM protein [Candidatus Aenigmarchaeota archaeon]
MEKEIAKKIFLWSKGEKVGPFKLQLNPTNRCNLKCKFCWLRDFDSGNLNLDEISEKKYREIIEEAYDLDVKEIEITGGGEPTMRRDILTIMESIKNHEMRGRLITNGTLLNEKIIKNLITIGWDEIVISLDAPNKEINDYLRGRGSFERATKAIKTLQIMKNTSDSEKPKLSIHMVLCNKNIHLLPETFEFIYSFGCKNLLVEPIVLLAEKTGAGKELLLEKKHEKLLLRYLKEATEVAYKHNCETNVDKLEMKFIENVNKMQEVVKKEGGKENFLLTPCYQPWYSMIIRPWGEVGPCCMFDGGESIIEKSLEEIWFGDFFENMRKLLAKNKLPDFCSKCNLSQIIENRKIRTELKKFR